MIRGLVMIAVAGLVLSIACFGVAAGLAGNDLVVSDVARWSWRGDRHGWDGHWVRDGDHRRHHRERHTGATTTRELAWTGGDSLSIEIPADVQYTQGPDARISISGPEAAVERVVVDGDELRFDGPRTGSARLSVVMTAPDVRRFVMRGSQTLSIEDYRQETLTVRLSGAGKVIASGQAERIDLEISGSGVADLGEVVADAAEVDISGSGQAVIAPKLSADLDLSGSGDVKLLTNPARLQSDVSGSGTVETLASAD